MPEPSDAEECSAMCNLMMSKHGLLKLIRNWYPLQNHSVCKRRGTTFDYTKSVLSSITPTFQSIVELQTEKGSKYIIAFWYFAEGEPAQFMIVNPPGQGLGRLLAQRRRSTPQDRTPEPTKMVGKSSRERWLCSGQTVIMSHGNCRPRARCTETGPGLPLHGSRANAVGTIDTATGE